MFVADEHILTKIEAADFEKKLIIGGENNEKNNYGNR